MKFFKVLIVGALLGLAACAPGQISSTKGGAVLKYEDFRHYATYFNRMEDENIAQAIPNAEAWNWMTQNIPLFEAPQQNFEEMFYYRWWTLRKHIKQTPKGYVMTEFLVDRSYADQYNMIACAMGHHVMEARWLRNSQYLDEYIHVWFRGKEGAPMKKLNSFSNWISDALIQKYYVDGDRDYLLDMMPDLIADYQRWELTRRHENGLFWQTDVADGMEEQISGGRRVKNARPTINSYMYANAAALAEMAGMINDSEMERLYRSKADTIRTLVLKGLWSADSTFFETRLENESFAGVREAIGFIPWYFNMPKAEHSIAWKQLMDAQGFLAPYGLTTAEQRHPEFRTHGCCRCEWDGAIWPFATSQTLTALANLLNNYEQQVVSKADYYKHMELYVESQYHRGRPYIGEYLDEETGYWLKGDQERSRYYNHSTFNDLIISGLVGLRPSAGNQLEINPLLPEGTWDWFCLDNVQYRGNIVTVIWDKDGSKYNRGLGLQVLVNGKVSATSTELGPLKIELPGEHKEAACAVEVLIEKEIPYGELMALSTIERNPVLYRSWGYMQGLLLSSIEALWKETGKEVYFDYIYAYASDMINSEGQIKGYEMNNFNIDDINAGKILINLYRETKEERFLIALKTLRRQMEIHPRTSEGGFWHKLKYPHQMWLDGAYMASPFLAHYAVEFDEPELLDDVCKQLLLMEKHLYDPSTDLLYHGWDESREMGWAHPETGQSSSFWGRSVGWYVMALVDVLEFLPTEHPQRPALLTVLDRTMRAVVSFQDKDSGVWFQVLDKGAFDGNYLESSASAMFAYVMAKGVNMGVLSAYFSKPLQMASSGMLAQFIVKDENGGMHITHGCRVAGLSAERNGSFEYYVSEPYQDDDLKAIGPFVLWSVEQEMR
jgi:rhamnogalacturonyl hydrolase YesR